MPVSKVVAQWSGWSGAPGLTAFHFDDARGNETSILAKVREFMNDFLSPTTTAVNLPGTINIDVQPIVETFDTLTGALLSTTVGTKPPVIDGIGSGGYASAVGACVSWTTGLVHDVPGAESGPHLVRGKTFFVPLVSNVFDANGAFNSADLTGMNSAVAAFLTAVPTFGVWSRPVAGAGGAFGVALAGVVRNKGAILRSRRD